MFQFSHHHQGACKALFGMRLQPLSEQCSHTTEPTTTMYFN